MITAAFHICVESLLRTERFYRDAIGLRVTRVGGDADGFVLVQSADPHWEIYAEPWRTCRDRRLEALLQEKLDRNALGIGMYLCLQCTNTSAAFQQAVHHGAYPVDPPANTPDGQCTAMIADPDGYRIMFCGPHEDTDRPVIEGDA